MTLARPYDIIGKTVRALLIASGGVWLVGLSPVILSPEIFAIIAFVLAVNASVCGVWLLFRPAAWPRILLEAAIVTSIGMLIIAIGIASSPRYDADWTAKDWAWLSGTAGLLCTPVVGFLIATYYARQLARPERHGHCGQCGALLNIGKPIRCPECGQSSHWSSPRAITVPQASGLAARATRATMLGCGLLMLGFLTPYLHDYFSPPDTGFLANMFDDVMYFVFFVGLMGVVMLASGIWLAIRPAKWRLALRIVSLAYVAILAVQLIWAKAAYVGGLPDAFPLVALAIHPPLFLAIATIYLWPLGRGGSSQNPLICDRCSYPLVGLVTVSCVACGHACDPASAVFEVPAPQPL